MERNILSMVRKEAAKIKNAMTAEKLFSRPEIKRQFSSMIDTLTQQYGESKIIIQMFHDESSSMTGGTDGNNIIINTGNSLVMFFSGLFEKYMAAMGLVFHEVSHILFTDFDKEKEMSEEIKNGKLYGELPLPQTQDEQEMLDEMMEA